MVIVSCGAVFRAYATIVFEIGTKVGYVRCGALFIDDDLMYNKRVREFQLQAVLQQPSPNVTLNQPNAWLFVVDPSSTLHDQLLFPTGHAHSIIIISLLTVYKNNLHFLPGMIPN